MHQNRDFAVGTQRDSTVRASPMSTLLAHLQSRLSALELDLPADVQARLIKYIDLLARWNKAYNLTAIRDPIAMIDRHLVDALAVLPHCRGPDLADIGTGPGIPGLVLALVHPYERVWLVDSNGKKARFLRECLRQFDLPQVVVHEARAEALAAAAFRQVISRAYSDLATFVSSTRQLLAPEGRWLAMKGKVPGSEIEALPDDVIVERIDVLKVPGADGERCLVTLCRAISSSGS